MQALTTIFDTTQLMPHGYCLVWNSALLWLHVISDALIVLSYYAIPLILFYFIRKYHDFPYSKLVIIFAAFIVACGTTHLFSIITLWQPLYWQEGLLKLLTAVLSLTTAIVMIVVTPKILAELGRNERLIEEMAQNSAIALATFESAQSMYVADAQGVFLTINQAFLKLTGYNRAELVGQKTSILKSGQHEMAFYNELWQSLITTGYWSGELWNKKKNGEAYFTLTNIIAVKDPQGCTTHYVVTGSDIGKIKAYEAGLIEAKENAEHFSTLKSQFIAGMSHEIRTPMTAIIGFSSLALYEDMPNQIRTYLQDINTSATSLLGILEDVLDFTKLEAGRVLIESLPFSVLDLLDTICTLFLGSAQQKGLAFTITRDRAMPLELIGDKLRLQQVLTNLVGNAIKFTAQGSVKLELTLQSINLSQVRVLFCVSDTGIGISLEDQDKLFKEFSQVDGSITRQYGGSGLGLVISQELVELMGSEISVVSNADQGSSFSCALSFDINNESTGYTTHLRQRSQELLCPANSNKLKGYRVLVVEDNPLSQKLIEKNLASLGIDTMIAAHGQDALVLLEQHDFDAVLMDIHMPIMNGIEATLLIYQQEKFARLPIIALSAGVTEKERNNCIACGMVDFIAKPIDTEQLCAVLELWLKLSEAD